MRSHEKIFLAHAGEVANKLLGALEAERLAARFVDAYVVEFDRQGLKDHPQRYRELLGTLGREALLAMVGQVNAELPRFVTRRRPPLLRGAEVEVADAFAQELLASLARALRWTPEEAEEFRRDLGLYAQLSARTQRVKKRPRPTDPAEGPFVDRCALLLDPSMLDNARHAAGKFLAGIEETTEAILQSTLRRRHRR
jgi:hypothetical protein